MKPALRADRQGTPRWTRICTFLHLVKGAGLTRGRGLCCVHPPLWADHHVSVISERTLLFLGRRGNTSENAATPQTISMKGGHTSGWEEKKNKTTRQEKGAEANISDLVKGKQDNKKESRLRGQRTGRRLHKGGVWRLKTRSIPSERGHRSKHTLGILFWNPVFQPPSADQCSLNTRCTSTSPCSLLKSSVYPLSLRHLSPCL